MRVLPEEPNLKSEKRVRSSNGSLKGSHGYKRESARGGIQIRTAASSLIALRLFVKSLRKMRPKKRVFSLYSKNLRISTKIYLCGFHLKVCQFSKRNRSKYCAKINDENKALRCIIFLTPTFALSYHTISLREVRKSSNNIVVKSEPTYQK